MENNSNSIRPYESTDFLKLLFSGVDIIIIYLLFIFSYFLFMRMYAIQEDLLLHLSIVLDKIEKGNLFLPVSYNSFMQWAIYLFGFGRKDLMFLSFPFILALSFAAKYIVMRFILLDYMLQQNLDYKNDWISRFGSLFACFAFPIYTFGQISTYWYRGATPPCVWHNPTVIFVMPFAMLLFWFTYKLIVNKTLFLGITVFILFVLNMFSKPVFLMPVIPIFTAFILFIGVNTDGGFFCSISKKKILYLAPFIIIATVMILYMYNRLFGKVGLSISLWETIKFHNNNYGFVSMVDFISKRFFHFNCVNYFFHNIIIIFAVMSRLFLNNAFFFVSLLLLKKKNLLLNIYAFLIWLFGIAIMFIVTEKEGAGHENFMWHVITCNAILIIAGLINVIYNHNCYDVCRSRIKGAIELVAYSALGIQMYCGILYIFRLILNGIWH